MHAPVVTCLYLVPLAALFAVLALIVVVLRNRHRVPYGDGDVVSMRRATRAHGNFAEWVPTVVFVVAAVELLGAPSDHVHWLMGALLIARVFHAAGLILGAFTTWAVLTVGTILLAVRVSAQWV